MSKGFLNLKLLWVRSLLVYRSFSLSRNKKINWKPSSGRSQENECYKRLIFKQFVEVLGLCGPQFLRKVKSGCLPFMLDPVEFSRPRSVRNQNFKSAAHEHDLFHMLFLKKSNLSLRSFEK